MNTTGYSYLNDFYGPAAHWYAIAAGAITSFTVLSNAFFILITVTSKSLRSKSSTWFLVGFAISDFLHGSSFVFGSYVIWNESINNRLACSIVGTVAVFTATSSFGFPFMISADRYYKITIPEIGKFSLGKKLFSNRLILPLIAGWFCMAALANLPLLLNNVFGEDPEGFCGAKKFVEVGLMVMYELSVMGIYFVSVSLTGLYYIRLAKWMKQHEHSNNPEGKRFTNELMMVTKLITLIPMVLATPSVVLNGGQMILPEIPIWVKRIVTLPYFMSSTVNPWLTISLVRPYRRRVLQVLRKFKILAITSSRVVDTTRHRSSTVQPAVVN